MLYAFDKRYGTCKFVWYSVGHIPVHQILLFKNFVFGNNILEAD
jgi:hypothetical protein